MDQEADKYNKFAKKDYGSAAAYAQAVRVWTCHHYWAMSQHAALLQQFTSRPFPHPQQQQQQQQQHQQSPPVSNTHESSRVIYQCASFPKRLGAELIDFVFFFAAKLLVVYLFVELNIFSLERYDRLLSDQADLQTLIDMTQELFPLEIMSKVLSSMVEALCISYGLRMAPRGCTPGKLLMRIRVVHYGRLEAIPLQGQSVVVIAGAEHVPIVNSIIRCLLKNVLLSFLFPLSIVIYAFQFNRAIYDVCAHTIVVEM